MEHRIRLTHSSYETIGSHSLTGMFVNSCLEQKIDPANITKLIIEVEQTPMAYRERHQPMIVMMPEFSPMCMMQDIMSLSKDFEVEFQEVFVNPCTKPRCCNWQIK